MSPRSSTALVLIVAAITGVALARAAGGAVPKRPATAMAPQPGASQASLPAAAASTHDDGEPDEPRAAPGDNP